jgi:hypothetical protein
MRAATRTTLWTLIAILMEGLAAGVGEARGGFGGPSAKDFGGAPSPASGEAVDEVVSTDLEPSEAPTGFDGASNGLVEASSALDGYKRLGSDDQRRLLVFLSSL